MNTRTCNCIGENERACCALRDKLTAEGYECTSLAPWERELYGEVEPYVDLFIVRNSGDPLRFFRVRGIYMTAAPVGHAPTLTFEDGDDKITHVPNVSYWWTEAATD